MAGQTVVISVLADTKKLASDFKSLSSGLGSLVGTAAKTVAGLAAGVAGLAIGGGISRALKIDEAKTKLEALGYTGKELDTVMSNALASVKGTSFGLDAAATVAAQALAAGVKPGKELEAQLTTVANTAALAGVDMGEMGSIFGKVWANGRVTTEEMNQLADRGVPIWQTLSKAFGVSNDELRKMISRGEVTADMFTGALGPAVDGMAEKMGSSFKGMAANTMAALSRLGAMFMGPLLEAAKPWLGWLTENIDTVAGKLEPFAAKFEAFLSKLSPDKVIPLIKKFTEFGDGLTNLSGPFSTVMGLAQQFSPLLGALAGALAPLMKHLPIVGKFLPTIGGPLGIIIGLIAGMAAGSSELQAVLGQFVQALAPVLLQIFEALAPVVAAVGTVLNDVALVLADALVPIIEALIPIVQLIGDLFVALSPILVALVAAVGGLVQALAPVVQIIAEALVPIIEALTKVLGGLIDFIVGVFTGDWDKAWSGIKDIFSGVWDAITGIVDLALDLIGSLFGTNADEMREAVDGFMADIGGFFKDGWDKVTQWTSEAWDNVKSWTKDAWDNVKSWTKDAWDNVKNAVSDGTHKTVETTKGWADDIGGKIKDTWNNVKSWTSDTWNNATTTVKNGWRDIKNGIGEGTRTTLNNTRSWMDNVKSGIDRGWTNVTNVFTRMPGRIRTALSGAGRWLLDTGRNVIQGLASGITNGVSSVVSAITDAVRGAIDTAKRLLGIHSPSRVFKQIGGFTVKGLEAGLSGPNKISSAMRNLTGQVEDGFDPSLQLSAGTARGGLGGITVNVTAGVGDPVEIGRTVRGYLRDYERAGGIA